MFRDAGPGRGDFGEDVGGCEGSRARVPVLLAAGILAEDAVRRFPIPWFVKIGGQLRRWRPPWFSASGGVSSQPLVAWFSFQGFWEGFIFFSMAISCCSVPFMVDGILGFLVLYGSWKDRSSFPVFSMLSDLCGLYGQQSSS